MTALNGVRMELEDANFPLIRRIVCTDDVTAAFTGASHQYRFPVAACNRYRC
jgi:hypothetical protein